MLDIYSLMAGIAIGLSLAVPPGPMNAIIAAESVKKSYISGIKVGLGAMTADAIFLVITLIGVSVLFTGDAMRMVVSITGSVILAYMGIMTLKGYNEPLKESEGVMKRHYLVGLTMGLMNPMQVIWWMTAGAALITNFNEMGVIGFFLGITIWVCSLSIALHYARTRIQGLYPVITLASGLCMVAFSIILLYNAAVISKLL